MTVLRYNPNRNYMQDTMNSLVNALFNTEFSEPAEQADELRPRMDMKEDPDKFTAKLTMPGLDPEKLEISITDDVLTIKGETTEETEEEDEKTSWLIRERAHSSYFRSIRLTSPVVADMAQAEYTNGILSLTLPKAEEVKPKTIPVKINA